MMQLHDNINCKMGWSCEEAQILFLSLGVLYFMCMCHSVDLCNIL